MKHGKECVVFSGLLGLFLNTSLQGYTFGLLDMCWSKLYYITPSGNTESHVAKDLKAGGRQGDTRGSPHDARTETSGQGAQDSLVLESSFRLVCVQRGGRKSCGCDLLLFHMETQGCRLCDGGCGRCCQISLLVLSKSRSEMGLGCSSSGRRLRQHQSGRMGCYWC